MCLNTPVSDKLSHPSHEVAKKEKQNKQYGAKSAAYDNEEHISAEEHPRRAWEYFVDLRDIIEGELREEVLGIMR